MDENVSVLFIFSFDVHLSFFFLGGGCDEICEKMFETFAPLSSRPLPSIPHLPDSTVGMSHSAAASHF